MLPTRHVRGVFLTTLVALLLACAGPAAAQVATPGAPPSPAEAMEAYQWLDDWVRRWRIGERDWVTPGNAGGASVVLRLDGQVVGRGSDVSGATNTLSAAAGQALAEAAGRLPVDRDALLEQNRRVLAERITISLELAGPLVPIAPVEYADAGAELVPGVDGVAARFGDQVAAMFPGTMLAAGMDGGRGLAAAIARASGDPAKGLVKPADLARDDGATFYRFRVVHLAQTAPGEPPIFLDRGGRVVQTADLTTEELRRWADGLAQHLTLRTNPDNPETMLRGRYDPVTGSFDLSSSSVVEQAAAALALTQYADLSHLSESRSATARNSARLVLREIGRAHAEKPDALPDAATAAMVWVALVASATGDISLLQRAEELLNQADHFPDSVPEQERSLAVWGLARRAVERGSAPKSIAPLVRKLFQDAGPERLVTHMPWLGWAELTMTRFTGDAEVPGPVPSAVALREMRSLVWKHQVQPETLALEQRDLAGGIAFTAARNPAPSWQSARPLAFIATMLGDPRLTEPHEVPAELSRLLQSLRFLRQLSAGPAECHMYADPQKAMWGVRASLLDQRMPVDATAMTLLTVCETLRTLEAIQSR